MEVNVFTETENTLSRSKKFYVALFDFLLVFFVCILLFVSFMAIFQSSERYKILHKNISETEKVLADVCVETKLTKYETTEDGKYLVSIERMAVDFVKGQVYAKFFDCEDERANDSYFDDVVKMSQDNDGCYYYLSAYKPSHISEYKVIEENLTINHYKDTLNKTLCFDEGEYPLLTMEKAEEIYVYMKDPKESDKAFEAVKKAYMSLVDECVSDFMNNSNEYGEKQQVYGSESQSLYIIYVYALLAVYTLSTIVVYLVLPLVLKDGQTVFMRLFKLRSLGVDGQPVEGGQVVIRFICQYILYMFCPLAILLLSMDISFFSMIAFTSFLQFFNLFTIGTFAFILAICNMIFTFYSKKKKQTISEFVAKTVTVEDTRVKTVNLMGVEVEVK